MPIYEYECTKCSSRFELKRHFGENSGAVCPDCKGEARRVFSPVPILFKGTGFYVTDNAAAARNSFSRGKSEDRTHDKENKSAPVEESKQEVAV